MQNLYDISELTDLIRNNLKQWNLNQNSEISLLTVSENATFIIKYDNTLHIIRVYRNNYHTDHEIHSELLWLQAIEQSSIVSVPHLYISQNGEKFIHCGAQNQRLACFNFKQGIEPKVDNNLNLWFTKLGEISAKLHQQSQQWQKPQGFIRKHWHYETMIGSQAYWGNWRAALGLTISEHKILEQCDAALKNKALTFPRDKKHYGLIHSDLRLANLLVNDQELIAIDFDDCGFSWFGLDLANALSFIEDDPIVPKLINAWYQGYALVRPVPDEMRAMMPHLIMMRRMQLTAWLASHSEVETAQQLGTHYNHATVKLAENYIKNYPPIHDQ